MKLIDNKITAKFNDMIADIITTCNRVLSTDTKVEEATSFDSKDDAKSRLKLVLMHDRSQLSPTQMEEMRDGIVEVIARYVDIDREALEVSLESESNTIALVANIAVVARTK